MQTILGTTHYLLLWGGDGEFLGITWFSGERDGGPIIQNLRENLGKFSWLGSFKPFSGERL